MLGGNAVAGVGVTAVQVGDGPGGGVAPGGGMLGGNAEGGVGVTGVQPNPAGVGDGGGVAA
jgi:hypothetical protein